MSIAELIMTGTQQASKSTDWVADSLAKIGDNVSKVLREREQNKQAQEMLPFLQQSMQESMKLAQDGDTAGAYSNMMGIFAANPDLMRNKAALPFFELGLNGIKESATRYKQGQEYNQRQAYYDNALAKKTGGGIPAMSPKEAAENALLTPNQNAPMTGDGTETIEIDTQTGQPIATLINAVDAKTPLPEMESVAQPDPSAALTNIAKTAKSEKFKSALMEVAKYPPTKETENDFRQSVQNYFALKNEEKKSVIDSHTSGFKGRKEAESTMGKDFYRVEDADRILGKQYEGLILKPSVEAKGTTIGKSQSVTYGTNAEDLRRFEGNVSGSVSELNQGKVGNFISNNGGVFNLDKETVEEEVKNKYSGNTQKEKVTYLFNKNNPDNRIKILDDSQIKAFDMLTIVPAELQRLTNRGATASLVAVERPTTKGPTREVAKTMPQAATAASGYKSKEDVGRAYQAGKLTKDQAISILKNQFQSE